MGWNTVAEVHARGRKITEELLGGKMQEIEDFDTCASPSCSGRDWTSVQLDEDQLRDIRTFPRSGSEFDSISE